MAKKDLTGGIQSLLGGKPQPEQPRPTATTATPVSAETRATFIVPEDLVNKLKAVAYWDRRLLKEVVADALEGYIQKYEKENGTIQPINKTR
ncbi:hypothetical protein GCM10027347_61470 [Larkinella harenae]